LPGVGAPLCVHPSLDEHAAWRQPRERANPLYLKTSSEMLDKLANLIPVHLAGASQSLQDHEYRVPGGMLIRCKTYLLA